MPFADVQGHERPKQILQRALAAGRMAHAYLFHGPTGVGKETLAVALFQRLNCPQGGADGCGTCSACRRIAADAQASRQKPERGDEDQIGWSYTDLHVLRPVGSFIRIEAVRALARRLPFPPVEARVRCILVRDAHALHPAAANALLKNLEEPTSHTLFVLVTEAPHLLLPTIRSRCQSVAFGGLEPKAVAHIVRAHAEVDDDSLPALVGLADGSPGRALELLGHEALAERVPFLRQVARLPAGSAADALRLAELLADRRHRDALPLYLHLLRLWCRDALLLDSGLAAESLVNRDLLPELRAELARGGHAAVLQRIAWLERAEQALRGNANVALTLDWLLVHFAHVR